MFALASFALLPAVLAAQSVGGRSEVFVNSELENYLRFLQSEGTAPLYPWSIRAFSPQEVDRIAPPDSAHPWAERYALANDTSRGVRWDWVRPKAQLIFNSTFPYGANDGPVWAGRGLTTVIEGGIAARYGIVSLVVAPTVFVAQNAAFKLAPNGRGGRLVFADEGYAGYIDRPQRFGDGVYTRVDPGQSTLRVDAHGVAVGVSTANQHWGPASVYPILLGNNAPGFAHGFIGTSGPWNIGLGKLHGRVVWGGLEQSDFSVVPGDSSRRFMSGALGVFIPRGLEGLEIGAGRFFHSPWPSRGLSARNFLKPFEGLLKSGLRETGEGPDFRSDADNQLASVFGRWVLPGSGFELYGEYGREDHNYDFRDFVAEPDHISAYMLGFRKLWRRSESRFATLGVEVLNAGISPLEQLRFQSPFYIHTLTRQGHTHRGQVLGSPAVHGGAGATLSANLYEPHGRWTFSWKREVRRPRLVGLEEVDQLFTEPDVFHALNLQRLLFRAKYQFLFGLTGVYEMNRNFGSDAFNLNATFSVGM